MKTNTVWECQEECINNAACEIFSYHDTDGMCFLKKESQAEKSTFNCVNLTYGGGKTCKNSLT